MRISDWSSDVCSSDLSVEIAIAQEAGRLVVSVLDDGVGLPRERDRITEPYVTTRMRGTGLGLAIVKKIVEEHFGSLEFLDRPGGGTIARLTFDMHLRAAARDERSEEHTYELQSLMRIPYAIFCLKKKHTTNSKNKTSTNK